MSPRVAKIDRTEQRALADSLRREETTLARWAEENWQRLGYASPRSARASAAQLLRSREGLSLSRDLGRPRRLSRARFRRLIPEIERTSVAAVSRRLHLRFGYASPESFAQTLRAMLQEEPREDGACAWCDTCDTGLAVIAPPAPCPACGTRTRPIPAAPRHALVLTDAQLRALHVAHASGESIPALAQRTWERAGAKSAPQMATAIRRGFARLGLAEQIARKPTLISEGELRDLGERIARGEDRLADFARAHWQRLGYSSAVTARVRIGALLRERGIRRTGPRGRGVYLDPETVRRLHARHMAGEAIGRIAEQEYASLGFTTPQTARVHIGRAFRRDGHQVILRTRPGGLV